MDKPRIVFVVGTRPEAIKVAPVVQEFRKFGEAETLLVSTGQHREILHSALAAFGLSADIDLDIMQHGQSLAQVTTRALDGLDQIFRDQSPAMVLAQGDTTTTFVSALGAFYRRIPFAHIEAGLRTDSIDNPFPEEFNRRAAGLVAQIHFPPTTWSRDNLLREGKPADRVHVVGNSGIDAVLQTAKIADSTWFPDHPGRVVLLTTHRRENWGEPQREIARAARALVDRHEDVLLVVAMHPNPVVRESLLPSLDGHPRVRLIEPPDYAPFVKLMQRSSLILSDSGGVQEEAPAFGIPVLVLRDTTERPEGVHAGTARLVGHRHEAILEQADLLLNDPAAYAAMAKAVSPYGDGKTSERIRFHALRELGIGTPEVPEWS